MSEYGEKIEEGAIRFRRVLPGPIERVWAYLTESDKRGEWLASGHWDLEEGGAIRLDFLHENLTPHDETIPDKYREMENGASYTGKVIECDPPRLIRFTWAEGLGENSEVTFELNPRDDGAVELVLTHRRMATREAFIGGSSGWHTHLAILEAKLAGEEPPPFWSTHARYEKEYEERFPA